jgi:hypothetical protein
LAADSNKNGKITGDMQRLELVKSHVASGFYNRRDVVEATASAVVKSQALNLLLDHFELSGRAPDSSQPAGASLKLDEIRRKIDDGFYDDPNYLAELAERLIKKFGLE